MQREIFELIEKVYFTDFGSNDGSELEFIDASEFELRKLAAREDGSLSKQDIESTVKRLRIQLDVVGRKCSDIILQNSQAYSVELKRVSDFKSLLEDSYQICAIARRALSMSEFMFVLPSIKLVKKQIKKSHLVKLYGAINEIKSFVIYF